MRSCWVYGIVLLTVATAAAAPRKKKSGRLEPRDQVDVHIKLTTTEPGRCDGTTRTARLEINASGRGNLQYAALGAPNAEGDQVVFLADEAKMSFSIDDRGGGTEQVGAGSLQSPPDVINMMFGLVVHNGFLIAQGDEGVGGLVTGNGPKLETTEYGTPCNTVLRRNMFQYAAVGAVYYDGKEDPKGWRSKKPKVNLDPGAIKKALDSGKPATFTSGAHYHWKEGDHTTVDADVQVTVRLHPPKVEARIVADDKLETWIPEGPTPTKKEGNTFAAHVELVDPDTGKAPGNIKVKSATFELAGVSTNPGVCGNWPILNGTADHDPDLYFDGARNKGAKAVKPGSVDLDADHWNKPVIVSSRDFGAYGQLTAHVVLDDDTPIAATFNDQPGLPLPLDKDGNHIADAWPKDKGQAFDSDDDANDPAIMSGGDGITAFDEYRGLIVSEGEHAIPAPKEQFVRLDPKIRDLIVLIDDPAHDAGIDAAMAAGVDGFAKAMKVEVFYLANKDRVGPHAGDKGLARAAFPNGGKSADVAAVWVSTNTPDRAAALATEKQRLADHKESNIHLATAVPLGDCGTEDSPNYGCLGNPAKIAWVRVFPDRVFVDSLAYPVKIFDPDADISTWGPNTQKAAHELGDKYTAMGYPPDKRRQIIAAFMKRSRDVQLSVIAWAVMHELGHVIGMFHHNEKVGGKGEYMGGGDDKCPMRYWNDQTDENFALWPKLFQFQWDLPNKNPQGTPWQFCTPNLGEASMKP